MWSNLNTGRGTITTDIVCCTTKVGNSHIYFYGGQRTVLQLRLELEEALKR